MIFAFVTLLLALAMFLGMLAFVEIGRRFGAARISREPGEGLAKGTSASEAAIFGLLGLIIAFTFSGAASRFEARRQLITEEANDIGTAYLRIDAVPEEAQSELRDLFRRYVDIRAEVYSNSSDVAATDAKLAETEKLQGLIWKKALAACRRPDAIGRPEILLFPSLNAMIDITTTRQTATKNHPPMPIFVLLAGLSLIGALLIGYDMSANQQRTWLHPIIFAGLMSLSFFVILDLEFPRLGLIRIDAEDQVLRDLRRTMH